MKRFLQAAAALCALTASSSLLLSACSRGAGNGAWNAAPSSAPRTALTFYTIQNETKVDAVIRDSIARFESANPGCTVSHQTIPNDIYKNRLSILVATNQMPDVFPTWSGGLLKEYVDIGRVADLRDFMAKDGYAARFDQRALNMAAYKGGLWGVPVENMSIALIFYNKAVFRKLGAAPPADWDGLLRLVKTLRAGGYTPFSLANRAGWTGSMYYMYLVDRLGGPQAFDNAANRKNGGSFADPVFVKAGQMIRQLMQEGAFNADCNWLDEDAGDSRQLLYNGSAAMLLDGSWTISSMKYENPEFEKNLGVFLFPAVAGGKGSPNDLVGTLGDNFYSIASSCASRGKAFGLIRYLIDDTAVTKRIAAGRIPPVANPQLGDPLTRQVFSYIRQAPAVQFWYDQYLPPKLSETHITLIRQLFEGGDPEALAQGMEAAARSLYGESPGSGE